MVIKDCIICGEKMKVSPSHEAKQFCSRECQWSHCPKVLTVCEICGKELERCPSKMNSTKHTYCSNKCKREGRKNGRIKECIVCSKEMYITPANERLVCCSRECQAESKVTGRTKECEICDVEFWAFKSAEERSGARFCSQQCSAINIRSKDFDPQARNNQGKKWANQVKKRDKCCQKCGATKELHAHHILSWKDYPELRFNIKNGTTVCIDCHIEIHYKAL